MAAQPSRGTDLLLTGQGAASVVDATGREIARAGHPGEVPGEALVAPFAVVPVVASGAAARFGFTGAELAVAAGGDEGSPLSRVVASSMLGRVRAALAVECPELLPRLDALVASGELTARRAALLATCCADAGCRESSHAADALLAAAGAAVIRAAVGEAKGGRTARALARGAAVIADPDRARWAGEPAWRPALRLVRDAMLQHPELVSGDEAIDTAIICATDGRVFARHDEAGALLLAVPERRLGIAVVSGQGAQTLARMATEVLAEIAAVDPLTLERVRRWLRLPSASAEVVLQRTIA